jgi:hypothetical protein
MSAGRRRRWPLRAYLGALVVLITFTALGSGLYARAQTDRGARATAYEGARFAAGQAVAQVQTDVAQVRAFVAQTAANPAIPSLFVAGAACSLTFPGVGAFTHAHLDVLRPDGSVVCSSAPGRRSYARSAWLPGAASAPVLAGPVVDVATGRPALVSIAQVKGYGAIAAFVDIGSVASGLATLFAGPRSLELLITSPDGRTAYARSVDPAKWAGTALGAAAFDHVGATADRRDVDGTPRLYGSASVPGLGWRVYAGAHRGRALADATRIRDQELTIVAGGLLAVLAGAILVHRAMTRPIRALTRSVQEAMASEAMPAVALSGPAEVAALAAQFNGLLVAVEHELVERRQAEDAARASERNYRTLFEANPHPMWVYDVETLRLLEVNDAIVTSYGYSRAELLAMTLDELVVDPDVPELLHQVATAGTVIRSGPWQHRRKDGTVIDVEITSHSVTFAERATRVAMAEDVTERHRMQTQINQSQRLESLGQLAGGIAHDFNNLLAVILNYASFVEERIAAAAVTDSALWGEPRADVEQIRRAAERAALLTHQLLAFARREVVHLEVLHVDAVVADIEPILRRTLGAHIELVVPPAAPTRPVRADVGQLEQVIVNLAVNARDAMPSGGRLIVDIQDVDVDEAYAANRPGLRPAHYVRLRVSDSGTGMDKATQERAFEPFFTTKAPGDGTGLGLATVYGIVRQAGGAVHIYSEPGRGTSISAYLPVTDESSSPDEAPEPATARPARGGETVLVVEDEEAMREVTARILERNGYHAIVAADGADALDVAAGYPGHIDVLLTDVVMPRMLGKDLANRLSGLRAGLRVVFMSGYAGAVLDVNGGLGDGVNLVEKPFSATVLLDTLQRVLDSPAPEVDPAAPARADPAA